jgi:AcrR family transcriptional regulator
VGRPAATEEQRRAQRRRIREAALALHGEKGIQGVTVRAIAQRAGISTGAVYSHFSSLAELAQSLWQAPLEKANERFRAIAEEEPDPLARIERLLGAYADFAHDHPEFLRGAMLFVRPTPVDRASRQPLEDLVFFRLLVDAVTAAQHEGLVRPGASQALALGAWAAVHGALALPVNLDRYEFGAPGEVSATAIAAALSALAV